MIFFFQVAYYFYYYVKLLFIYNIKISGTESHDVLKNVLNWYKNVHIVLNLYNKNDH